MLLELLKNYADMVNSATRMTQRSATAMARTMLIQAGMEPAADMVSKLSEQLISAQEAQYAMMRRMVQAEVEMTMIRMGALPAGDAASEHDPAQERDAAAEPDETRELKVVDGTTGRDAGAALAQAESGTPEATTPEPVKLAPEPEPSMTAAGKPESVQPEATTPESVTLVPEPKQTAEAEASPKGSESEAEAGTVAPAKKAPAKRATARKTAARKTTTAKSATSGTSAAKRTNAKTTNSAKTTKSATKRSTKSTTARSARKTGGSGDSPDTPKASS